RCGHSEPHDLWRSVHSNADCVGSRGWVSLAGDFANAAVEVHAGSGPERDLGLLAYPEMSGILFGDRNGDLGLPRVGQRDDSLTGTYDLSRLSHYRSDSAGLVGLQRCVSDCIGSLTKLRLCRIERRYGRLHLVASGVVSRLRNDRLWQEGLAALQIVACHIATAARRGD